jgi:hypothetical protein
MASFPLESYLYETFGVQSSSRDFSILKVSNNILGLQTALDRYKFSEPQEISPVPADSKKKEKAPAIQSEDATQTGGIFCKFVNILIS